MKEQAGARRDSRGRQATSDAQVMQGTAEASPRRLARIAGALYVLNILAGFFAIGYVPAALIVSGDPAATAHNIVAHELLYRFGLVAHLIPIMCNVPLAVIFYDLFKVVSRRLALLVVFFTLVGTAIEGANLLDQFAPLKLLSSGQTLSAFTTEQVQVLAYVPLALQAPAYNLQQVIYAGYLLTAAYLVWRCTFLPRAVGVLLAIGGLSYLINSVAALLAPGFAARLFPYIQLPSGLAEISFCLWLLVAGVNVARWEQQAHRALEPDQSVPASAAVP